MTENVEIIPTVLEPTGEFGQFKDAIAHYGLITQFVSRVLKRDIDYGLIKGTKKPTLYKAGAEKLCQLFKLRPEFILEDSIQDWTGKNHGLNEPLFHYRYKCVLYYPRTGGQPVGNGFGSCNSLENKYRGDNWNWNLVNTIDKMAQKRCLSSATQVLIKTSRGVFRDDLNSLYTLYQNENENLYLPGTDGTWRFVKGMIKDENRFVYRIDLEDGSYIRATAEHRFPTSSGIKVVDELQQGDILLRTKIPFDHSSKAWVNIGWIVGLFIAEGSFCSKSEKHTGVRFTLNSERGDLLKKVTEIAEFLGANVSVVPKKGEKAISVNVTGSQFKGLIEHFVLGDSCYNKHLSKEAWRQGKNFILELLDGYLQGDGCWTVSKVQKRQPFWRIGFTGENREWANDLRSICAILNYRLLLKRSKAHCRGIEFPTFTGWIKTHVSKYNAKPLEKIVNIALETKPSTVYDIEVDGNHLFCLANGIQTHNSFVSAVLSTTGVSAFFSQDLEDWQQVVNGDETKELKKRLCDRVLELVGELGWSIEDAKQYLLTRFGVTGRAQLSPTQLQQLLQEMEGMLRG